MNNILECRNLSKSFNKKGKQIIVLKDVNFIFKKGKLYAIKGKSGAGKSTLIQILGLFNKQSSGHIYINEQNTENLNSKEIALLRNKKIGFIFQSYYLNPLLKAYENVMLPLNIDNNLSFNEKKQKAILQLEALGLKERINHFPSELSGGEQQRVAIARALINNPEIILADEPTGSLDLENEAAVFKLLQNLAEQGKCVIVVTHTNIVKEYADVILNLKNGKLEKAGNKFE